MAHPGANSASENDLLTACQQVLAPLAELGLARGLRCADLEALLRRCFVQAARAAHPVPPHRAVSRISAATGLHRREVARLLQTSTGGTAPRRSPAAEVFTRWVSDPAYRAADGKPLRLPRQGPSPSFESLAQSVTRDVHPRSLLEEVSRLGLARLDAGSDEVELLCDAFVPRHDERRLLEALGANVGDHLQAAAANLDGAPSTVHLERSLFADELSAASIARLRPLFDAQWQTLIRSLAPQIQALIDEDAAAGRETGHRVRVGLYTYHTTVSAEPETGTQPKEES